jgi:P-type E1-E2 ATPase
VLVGRPDWVLSQLPNSATTSATQLQQAAAADAAAGKSTQVYVAVGDQLLGGLGFRDTLRQDAVETVAALKRMGLRVFLLSGDDTATVKAVAAQAGIAAGDAYGSNTPKQKLDVIRHLQVRADVLLLLCEMHVIQLVLVMHMAAAHQCRS